VIGPDASGPGDLSHPIQQCHPTAAFLGARSDVAGLIPFPQATTPALESFLESDGNDDKALAAFPAALASPLCRRFGEKLSTRAEIFAAGTDEVLCHDA